MKAELRVRVCYQHCLDSLEFLKSRINFPLTPTAFVSCECNVLFKVSRFGRQQARIEPAKFFRQARGELRKALARSGLDDCANKQQVELFVWLIRPYSIAQTTGIAGGREPFESDFHILHDRTYLLKVAKLFACQP